ncbi:hypothetical protein ACI65C_011096 [Semiaphis heraclei]
MSLSPNTKTKTNIKNKNINNNNTNNKTIIQDACLNLSTNNPNVSHSPTQNNLNSPNNDGWTHQAEKRNRSSSSEPSSPTQNTNRHKKLFISRNRFDVLSQNETIEVDTITPNPDPDVSSPEANTSQSNPKTTVKTSSAESNPSPSQNRTYANVTSNQEPPKSNNSNQLDTVPQEILFNISDDEEDFDEDVQLSNGEDEIDADPVTLNVPQQALETYFTVPGIRLNSIVYMDNIGYKYYKNISRNNKINPDGAKNYTFLQCQSRVQRMRQCRRPQSVDTIEELAHILSLEQNKSYASTLQRPPSRFFQETFEANDEVVGVIFFNLDAIQKYQHELLSVKIAGVDGTFKTVPKRPPQFNKGCLLTFHVLFKNVVS